MQAGFGLERLTGEAVVGKVAGAGVNAAEGIVGGGPDFCACGVGRKHGPPDVVGADEGDDAAFDGR